MGRSDRKRAQRLRLVVDTLPYQTRVAMLEGLQRFDIIAGAYSDRGGGVCPMLAAHRCGGRTDHRSFARAWDRFTGAGKRSRRASERDLRTLAAQLEASIWKDDDARHAQHDGEPVARTVSQAPPAGTEASPLGAWLLPFRDLDEYLRALEGALLQVGDGPHRPTKKERRLNAPVGI
jgi:hypothetical protein